MSDALATARAQLLSLTETIAALDLSDAAGAQAALSASHPLTALTDVEAACRAAFAEGTLTPRRASDAVTFGRVVKPSAESHGLSVDAVEMEGPAAPHTHPKGEVSLCWANGGDDPRFMGHGPGWVVVPPGSRHTPTVTGGRMLIVYFLPDGAMTWG